MIAHFFSFFFSLPSTARFMRVCTSGGDSKREREREREREKEREREREREKSELRRGRRQAIFFPPLLGVHFGRAV
jgi:hypothetical protein